ncbi:hypothetical protein EUTSA_v10010406mg [Eutrema salsugineum]|uniref:Uncharacterized protein n=1 Tax=Eutrema salsugineum TaxID=72664 RepID=V4LST3_EUTSA|nr:hypothetical protein EUTSA_v10010406mg [Eutrema salsugineum]
MAFKSKPRSEMDIPDRSANQQSEDAKIDILKCANQMDEFQEEEEVSCQSSSSSFGDSMCASDDDEFGFEAQSMLSKDYPLPETYDDGTDFLGLRKKKLTDEWRRFCQPLMWRCKWLELKVKEIESQAKVYENEVRSYYETKQFDLEKSKLKGFDGRSIPFHDQTQRMNVFKRGRRKRVEDTTDVAAYMSSHNVFSYAEKRKPATFKAQYPVPGRKAMCKEDETEDDCLVSELDCSDDFLAKILCKIDEAQDKAKRLRKRVDQLMCESQTAHTSLMPRTIARCRSDFTVHTVKHQALVEEPLMPHTAAHSQREATVQIGRQRISADHTEDLLIPQAPLVQSDGQCLTNNSPLSSGGLRFNTFLEDLLMDDEPEMNDDEAETGEEQLDYFRKLMNEITGAHPSDEADEEEDPTPVAKRHKTSH